MLNQQMYLGGPGSVIWTQKTDYLGNAIVNPTPAILGVLQDHTIDNKKGTKSLFGDQNLSVAVMSGKIETAIDVKIGTLDQILANSIYWGQTVTVGSLTGIYLDQTAGTAIPATPFTITVTPPYSGTWQRDLGVYNVANNKRLTRVASSPAAGQYSVTAGAYLFSSADNVAGIIVRISYTYTATSTDATTQSILPAPIGPVVTGTLDILKRNVNSASFHMESYSNVICGDLKMPAKQDDFTINELKFVPFYAGGTYCTISEYNA